jgi:hypothetical protein
MTRPQDRQAINIKNIIEKNIKMSDERGLPPTASCSRIIFSNKSKNDL